MMVYSDLVAYNMVAAVLKIGENISLHYICSMAWGSILSLKFLSMNKERILLLKNA